MKRLQETAARRIVRMLDREVRSRGRGSIRALERAVGRSEGWWQHRAESGDISVRQLLCVLDHLGLDPVRFFRAALGREFGLELDRPRGNPPEIVEKALERVRSVQQVNGIGETYLETLDQQRYREPGEVVRLTLWAVDHVELELLPRLLGVAGSALKLLIRLDEAEHAIHAGVEIAQAQRDSIALGDLLQRLGYVVADRGEYAQALRLAVEAGTIYLRHGDRMVVGRALVDQGIWLYYLDRPRESLSALASALELLPEGPSRNRSTAFQVMGLAYQTRGNLEAALRSVISAQKESVGIESWAKGKLFWLRGRIHFDRADCVDKAELDQAASCFSETIDIFRELHPGETALATCELIRVQLLLKRHDEAYLTAISMRTLLEPLRFNEVVSAAIADLLRCGQEGLTLALVERVKNRIEGKRKCRLVWRALRVEA